MKNVMSAAAQPNFLQPNLQRMESWVLPELGDHCHGITVELEDLEKSLLSDIESVQVASLIAELENGELVNNLSQIEESDFLPHYDDSSILSSFSPTVTAPVDQFNCLTLGQQQHPEQDQKQPQQQQQRNKRMSLAPLTSPKKKSILMLGNDSSDDMIYLKEGGLRSSSRLHRSLSSHVLGQFSSTSLSPSLSPSSSSSLSSSSSSSSSSALDSAMQGLATAASSSPSALLSHLLECNNSGDFAASIRRVCSTGDLQQQQQQQQPRSSSKEDGEYKIGSYSIAERKERIDRYKHKRSERNFNKKIKYACRKTLADSRPRVRGRFAKNEDSPQH